MAFFMQVGMCFQHSTGYFKDRMTPVAEYGAVAGKMAASYLKVLEKQLASNQFIAGNSYSIADITALCSIDFARVVKIKMSDDQANLQRWYQQVSSRASAKA
jgi:glutathione S-transferase